MNIVRMQKILRLHSVECREIVSKTTGEVRVIAYEIVTQKRGNVTIDISHWIDVTDFTREELFSWLGY